MQSRTQLCFLDMYTHPQSKKKFCYCYFLKSLFLYLLISPSFLLPYFSPPHTVYTCMRMYRSPHMQVREHLATIDSFLPHIGLKDCTNISWHLLATILLALNFLTLSVQADIPEHALQLKILKSQSNEHLYLLEFCFIYMWPHMLFTLVLAYYEYFIIIGLLENLEKFKTILGE